MAAGAIMHANWGQIPINSANWTMPLNAEFRESRSGGSDLVEQVGMTLKHLEQLYQSQRRLGLAVFIAREGIDTAAEDFSSFALVESEFLAHAGDEARIDDGRIHLLGEG